MNEADRHHYVSTWESLSVKAQRYLLALHADLPFEDDEALDEAIELGLVQVVEPRLTVLGLFTVQVRT